MEADFSWEDWKYAAKLERNIVFNDCNDALEYTVSSKFALISRSYKETKDA